MIQVNWGLSSHQKKWAVFLFCVVYIMNYHFILTILSGTRLARFLMLILLRFANPSTWSDWPTAGPSSRPRGTDVDGSGKRFAFRSYRGAGGDGDRGWGR